MFLKRAPFLLNFNVSGIPLFLFEKSLSTYHYRRIGFQSTRRRSRKPDTSWEVTFDRHRSACIPPKSHPTWVSRRRETWHFCTENQTPPGTAADIHLLSPSSAEFSYRFLLEPSLGFSQTSTTSHNLALEKGKPSNKTICRTIHPDRI